MEHKQKRTKPKNPIKFKLILNEEQKNAKQLILDNTITVLSGGAGSGKTLLACQIALDLKFTKQIDKIIISRPAVSSEDIGFIPGDLKEKMNPYLEPIYHNMYQLYDRIKIDKMMEEGDIEIGPVGFMRGKTFVDSIIIVDEAQNVTAEQMLTILTRVGRNSKLIICGDSSQKDLDQRKTSGFGDAVTMANTILGFGHYKLEQNHRAGIVTDVIKWYSHRI